MFTTKILLLDEIDDLVTKERYKTKEMVLYINTQTLNKLAKEAHINAHVLHGVVNITAAGHIVKNGAPYSREVPSILSCGRRIPVLVDSTLKNGTMALLSVHPWFHCEVCGEKKENEPSHSVGDLKDVCSECYQRGIVWAIRKAAEESRKRNTEYDEIPKKVARGVRSAR